MKVHIITINWEGPLNVEKAISEKNDGGTSPDWNGDDYGLYQIYGKHIISGIKSLLYIGEVTKQTYSDRFKQHYDEWLNKEENVQIYLGRVLNLDDWEKDVKMAEAVLIYKYSPNYNSRGISEKPLITPYEKIKLVHRGERAKLDNEDIAPEDYS